MGFIQVLVRSAFGEAIVSHSGLEGMASVQACKPHATLGVYINYSINTIRASDNYLKL
jgi:hypothetical protein